MKKFKMPSAYTILISIIMVVAILTWMIPAGEYEQEDGKPIAGTYHSVEANPQGLWEIVQAPIKGFFDAKDVAFFILVIGGFLSIVMKTGAIDAGVGSVVKNLKGREQIMIPVLMILFGLGGTTYGMAEETIAFYPLIIPVILAAGYDTVTAVSVILLGAGAGVLGSTVNPFATGIAAGFAGVSIGQGIGLRVLILIVVELAAIVFVMKYAKKVKDDPTKSLVYDMREDNKEHFLSGDDGKKELVELTKKRKLVLWVFGLTFLIMILSVIPWASKFNITLFENINNTLKSLPVIGPLLGDLPALGDFWFAEITALFLVSSIVIGLIYRMKEKEFVDVFVNGAKDLLGVALIIGISRGITVVMNDGNITATVLHWGETVLANLGSIAFVNLSYFFYIAMSFLVPSSSGLATLSMPVLAPLADFVGVGRELVITVYQSASGIVNLVTPTSGVVMGALAIARLPYERWIKYLWKFIAVLMVIIIVALSLGVLF